MVFYNHCAYLCAAAAVVQAGEAENLCKRVGKHLSILNFSV
jgi:hypothetical protein